MKNLLACLLFSLAILGPAAGSFGADTTPLPEEMTANGIAYRSGGIGLTEREGLTAIEDRYSLKLVFALKEGNYVADVTVEILEASGRKLLDISSAGPWFYAALPKGSFKVQVTRHGTTQTREVRIAGKGLKTVRILW